MDHQYIGILVDGSSGRFEMGNLNGRNFCFKK